MLGEVAADPERREAAKEDGRRSTPTLNGPDVFASVHMKRIDTAQDLTKRRRPARAEAALRRSDVPGARWIRRAADHEGSSHALQLCLDLEPTAHRLVSCRW